MAVLSSITHYPVKRVQTRLTVIRHGETDWNVEGRIQGHQESELNERGRRQAAALDGCFEAGSADAVYSSDLRRTMDTARPVADALGLEIRRDKRLREWNLGCMEKMLLSEARLRVPDAIRIYDERLVDAVVPGGESIRKRYERFTACLVEVANRHAGGHAVVVTHGGILDDIYKFVHRLDLDVPCEWELFNCGINRLTKAGETWRADVWGEVRHLDGIGSMTTWNER